MNGGGGGIYFSSRVKSDSTLPCSLYQYPQCFGFGSGTGWIRIDFGRLDPDTGGQKWPTKIRVGKNPVFFKKKPAQWFFFGFFWFFFGFLPGREGF
jgi:hypothetical protein